MHDWFSLEVAVVSQYVEISDLNLRLRNSLLHALPPRWAGWLRVWKMRRSLKTFHPRWVTHQYGENTFQVRIEDDLGQWWYDNDWQELPEIAFHAQRKLKPGATVFDFGAHQGIVAMMLASKVKQEGLVLAVEANEHNARLARLNAQTNVIPQLRVVEAAVADKVGTILLNEGLNAQLDDGTAALGQTRVDCLTIDHLAEQFGMPKVVFMDIEGAECLALQGGRQVLASRADFFVEVHVNFGLEKLGGSVEKILSFFPRDQFEVFVRRESEREFRTIDKDPIFKDRFFLIAVERDQ
ncbi:MAG: FkbM family methyltransferase [Verrucomicrobia subdivision 3 bacterium]|nr:FkbM family methyltransferase [Limisphaerales bacterium]